MAHPALGRILDPAVLDEEGGARGRLRITVPSAWLEAPCELELLVPLRLPCARCDGGGCDGCGRSGAVKAPSDEAERTLSTHLPRVEAEGVALRISRPFGPEGGIEQLFLEVCAGEVASAGVRRRLAPLAIGVPSAPPLWPTGLIFSLVALAALIAGWLAR